MAQLSSSQISLRRQSADRLRQHCVTVYSFSKNHFSSDRKNVGMECADIPAVTEGVLALALREAVTNVIRHAKATSCSLTLHMGPGGCRLEIRDDGCGQMTPEGVGLSGMRRRVEALGGKLQREAASGTRLV